MLVSLPGKLAQRCASWVQAPEVIPPAAWASWWQRWPSGEPVRLRALSDSCQRQERAEWTYDSAPAVACWILSAARVELLRAIRIAGWEECVYWDTDSLLLTRAGWDRLSERADLIGVGLGQWRLVREVSLAHIHGIKHYDHDGDTTCAGRPRADVQATRLKDYYWYRATFGMALADYHAPSAARKLRRFERAPKYALGRIGDNGRVHPFDVEEW